MFRFEIEECDFIRHVLGVLMEECDFNSHVLVLIIEECGFISHVLGLIVEECDFNSHVLGVISPDTTYEKIENLFRKQLTTSRMTNIIGMVTKCQ